MTEYAKSKYKELLQRGQTNENIPLQLVAQFVAKYRFLKRPKQDYLHKNI